MSHGISGLSWSLTNPAEVEVSSSSKTVTKKFPRTVTIGKLSGLIGRLFGANPLDLALYLVEDGIVGEEGVRETL
ncbi:hypothetical protein ABW20_dc0100991 [Dactylellina cionopaga]|nr:hypothetical protein ABW20_dc0100991 [Dactylellina cionopaga]